MAAHSSTPSMDATPQGGEAGTVRLERVGTTGRVALLTLSRPAALNAMTWAMYQQLEAHLNALADETETRVIVLRGDGPRAFASGTDIAQFAAFTGADGVAYERQVERIMERLTAMPQPLIAAVHGYAVGSGCAVATACDLRYATSEARFGVPVARTLGNCLSLGNYRRMARAFGLMRAKEMLLTGTLLPASEALRAGYLTAIFEGEGFFARVLEVAEGIAANAPLTLWATKEAYRRLDATEERALVAATPFDDVIERVYASEDFHEGVRAHGEKRPAQWQGR